MPWLVERNDLGGIDVYHSDYVPHAVGTVFPDDQEQAAWLHALDCIEDHMYGLRSSARTARKNLRRIRRKEIAQATALKARSATDV